MSNKSSTSIISLPKGGGALQGIGEKFAPDLFTGTGNFTVPIALPPGRNGFQPELNLVYSTGNGNGPFGLGWSLSIPGVSRKTSKGIPIYDDSKDTFILSGAEDLVPVEASDNTTRYRPCTEGLFARIAHHKDTENDYWKMCSKDGLISYYGTPRRDEPDPDWRDPAVLADPDPLKRNKVFAWKLTETRDPFGNRIVYEYERDRGEENSHHWDQLYLKQIRYVEYDHEATGEERFLVSVTFDYSLPGERPDHFSEYRPGFEIRTRKRCKQIVVRTHADKDRRVRTYKLIYLDERVADGELPETVLPLNNLSPLSQIKVLGHDDDQPEIDDQTEELPPLEFGYTRFEPEKRDFFPLEGSVPSRSLADSSLELVDLFGNGLPDIMEMNGTVRYWRNVGNGKFDLPREMREAPVGLKLADPGVQMIDADGDGRTDLLVTAPRLFGYFPLRFGGLWDRRSFQKYDFAPSFSLEDPEVKLVDLDGDGVTDAIRSGTRLECFFNDPKEGWKNTRLVDRRDFDEFPNVNFSDPRIRFNDMSGDGLQDIVLIYDGNVEYWPNLGHGNWGKRISMRNSPHFPLGYDPRRILVGDVDGDGLADIVYVDHCKVLLFINQSGNGWSDPIEIDGTPEVTDVDAVRLADMLGTGIGGVLWSRDAAEPGRDTLLFLDFTGEDKPYLLNEMNNNMGAITRIKYAPSTHFYLEDQKQPETRWKTPLPFPVLVVSCVEVIDEISKGKLTTEYFYHHGYWDGTEREFRGFGRVEQRDTELFEDFHTPGLHPDKTFEAVEQRMFSPPLETRTWFHQGPIGDEFEEQKETDYGNEYWDGDPNVLERPASMRDFLKNLPRRVRHDALRTLRGTILRTELYALDGSERQERPYTVTESVYGLREESGPGDDETRIFFPHALAQRTTQWERGDDPMTQVSFTESYDEYGQPTKQIDIACPRGWRKIEDNIPQDRPFLATYNQIVFAYSDGDVPYIKDRVAKTTSYELRHLGNKTLFEFKNETANPDALELIGQSLTYYDGEAFTGLPFGRIGPYGAAVHSEGIVLTEEILQEAYKSESDSNSPTEIPPYLVPGTPPNWTDEYPQSFQERIPELAGYTFHDGSGPEAPGYFACKGCTRFDFHDNPNGKGLPLVRRDPLGGDTSTEYDTYNLLPIKVTNPIVLTRQTEYDYRVLQPYLSMDQNGNRTHFSFSPLGFLVSVAVMGKEGESLGDTIEVPSTRLEYDFLAFKNSLPEARQPIYVRTIQREYHINNNDVPAGKKENTIIKVEYSDGFGRLIQTRTQVEDVLFGDEHFGTDIIPANQSIEPGTSIGRRRESDNSPNVMVSGWQVYDNKGQIVQQYEPFFSTGFEFSPPADSQFGQKAEMFYDPRGQLIKTINPDGSMKRVFFGIPRHLNTPDDFLPTPWEAYTYDANDNAEIFEGKHHVDSSHLHTPTSIEIDSLGRTIKSVTHIGETVQDKFVILSEYDIRGNLLSITDPIGRVAFKYVYDLTFSDETESRVLCEESIDSGLQRIVFDAIGREIERRDSKGAVILQAYDDINRPTYLWARDSQTLPMTLRQHLVYGDNAGLNQPENNNLIGKLYQHFDEAGLLEIPAYDFRGRFLSQIRRFISDAEILSVMGSAEFTNYQVDWEKENAESVLDEKVHQTDVSYDALARFIRITYPVDVEDDRKVLLPIYSRTGALQSISLLSQNEANEQVFVKYIAYNAKGQRSLIAYGNGLMTRYAYDPTTFRLVRMRTEKYKQEGEIDFIPDGGLLQDLGYEYDLVGNIILIRNRSPGSGIPGTSSGKDALAREFSYDPIYRLTLATGREHISRNPSNEPWLDAMFPTNQDITQTRQYTRQYTYDKAGNLTELQHIAPNGGGSFTRRFNIISGNNRLENFIQGGNPFVYQYDANGNMTQETSSRHFHWNHSDRLHAFRIQTGGSIPSVEAVYLYDAAGQRVKKVVRKQGGSINTNTYIGNFFEYHTHDDQENDTLHIMDDQNRVALVRVGDAFPADNSPAIQYNIADHLRSSHFIVDESGSLIHREEYYPYGGTSFGGFAKKRYRFTGKEQDEESGLNYHRARYYAPWAMKWISTDPAGRVDGLNLYSYGRNNPLSFIDTDGTNAWEWLKGAASSVWSDFKTLNWEGKYPWKFPKIFKGASLPTGKRPYEWSKESWGIILDKTKHYASNIWGWAKQHKYMSIGIAIGVAIFGIFNGKTVWNWVLAPAIRTATNAAMGYALWGSTGAWIGAGTGVMHGLAMARAGSYDWKGWGWALFILDNTWSLFNSFVGSLYATITAGPFGPINEKQSQNEDTPGSVYYDNGLRWWGRSTTLGNVTVGKTFPVHEWQHALQARLFGPFYIPAVILGYELALIPYWLPFKKCNISGLGDYFMKGVYPNTWHELWAYAVDGNPC